MTDRGDLPARLRDHVRRRNLLEPGQHLVVALSGGLDSVVLLHLLRFHPPVHALQVSAAHMDHGMRPGSAADARWIRGLTRAWDVELRSEVAEPAPATEGQARRVRYAFLHRVAAEAGADRLATAHHADDQAETVLFRAVRGTGLAGLRGIRERGREGLVRPLLPFWREELEGYARGAGLGWRADPTNRDTGYARNVLRHRVLPVLEAEVAPGARKALVRLARNARREERAWQSLLPELLDRVVRDGEGEGEEGRIVVARNALLAYPSEVRVRVVRALARRLGVVLDEAGTRTAMEFTMSGPSGRGIHLAGGLRLRRDFDGLTFLREPVGRHGGDESDTVTVPGTGPGSARLTLEGRSWTVRWGPRVTGRWTATFPRARLRFPLRLRSWRPGDRIRLAYGSKKLAKLFAERRVPVPERSRRPVVVDAEGTVLWVPGVGRSSGAEPGETGESLTLGIDDADND